MSFKEKFPNEAALKQAIIDGWGYFTQEVQMKVGPMQAEFKIISRRRKIGGVFIFFPVISLGFIKVLNEVDSFSSSFVEVAVISAIFLAIITGIVGFYLMQDKNNIIGLFNQDIDELIFPKIFGLLGINGVRMTKTYDLDAKKLKKDKEMSPLMKNSSLLSYAFQKNSPEFRQVLELLDHSELVTEKHNTVMLDDMIHISMDRGILFVSELNLKNIKRNGKNQTVTNIFKGYFVSFDLDRRLTGKTFISTEEDKKGFGHRSFWTNIKGKGAIETKLEWNEFENLLHVATTDPTEARYVLTPNFMANLYDWWNGKKQNIRISFVDNRMYMLFPDNKIRFFKTIPEIDTKFLQEYFESIARPLLHILHLIEDVPRR